MAARPLDQILSAQGFGSRRDCARMIRRGDVLVQGQVVRDPKVRREPFGLVLEVSGVAWQSVEHVYLAMNKAVGFECSRKPTHHPSVIEGLPEHLKRRGIQPVGRLDHDTSGLLLLSDDGAFNHAMTSPRRHVTKRYAVSVEGDVDADFLAQLHEGVRLHGEFQDTKALKCELKGPRSFEMSIAQGKYHQVKRMVAAAGQRVIALSRVAIGGLELSALQLEPGETRALRESELVALRSSN